MDTKLKYFIISTLRRRSKCWKPAQDALNKVKEIYYITSKKGKQLRRVKFKCYKCNKFFGRKEIQIHHKFPVVDPTIGFTTWDMYINRMFCPNEEYYEIICKPCHKEENRKGRELKKLNKKSVDKS